MDNYPSYTHYLFLMGIIHQTEWARVDTKVINIVLDYVLVFDWNGTAYIDTVFLVLDLKRFYKILICNKIIHI